jgi:hypothetical protein
MEARHKRFTEYDFDNSPGWKAFLKSLYFNPARAQIDKFKRQWFKDNVDTQYNVDYEPPVVSPVDDSQFSKPCTCTGTPNLLGLLECVLLLLVLPGTFNGTGLYFALAAFCLGLLSNTGVPQMNSDYFTLVTFSDDLHSVVFCVMFLFYPSNMWVLPVAIGAASRLSEILYKWGSTPSLLKSLVTSLYSKKFELDSSKAQVEVGMGVAAVLLALSGGKGLVFGFAYWNFLRMKYIVNLHTTAAFSTLRVIGDSYLVRAPQPFAKLWDKLKWACGALTTSSQPGVCSVM